MIAPTGDQWRAFVDLLPPEEYYGDPATALEAQRTQTQFNVIDLEGGWKVDFIVRKRSGGGRGSAPPLGSGLSP